MQELRSLVRNILEPSWFEEQSLLITLMITNYFMRTIYVLMYMFKYEDFLL